MTKRSRAEFNEWLVDRKDPIAVGGKEYSSLELLKDTTTLAYDVVYERWAARERGGTEPYSGVAYEELARRQSR